LRGAKSNDGRHGGTSQHKFSREDSPFVFLRRLLFGIQVKTTVTAPLIQYSGQIDGNLMFVVLRGDDIGLSMPPRPHPTPLPQPLQPIGFGIDRRHRARCDGDHRCMPPHSLPLRLGHRRALA
jgi:hypothetical protein